MLEVGNRLLKSVNACAAFTMAQANWASWGCHIRRRAPERAAPPERDASPDRASLRAQPKRRVCTRGEDPEWTGIAGGHWHENKDGSKRWIPNDRQVKLSGPEDSAWKGACISGKKGSQVSPVWAAARVGSAREGHCSAREGHCRNWSCRLSLRLRLCASRAAGSGPAPSPAAGSSLRPAASSAGRSYPAVAAVGRGLV